MAPEEFPAMRITQVQFEALAKQFSDNMKFASVTTKHVYRKAIDRLVSYAALYPFRFTPDDFREFRLWLLDRAKLSTNTVNTYLTASRRFCDFLVDRGVLHKNPAWSFHGTAQSHKVFGATLSEVANAVSLIDRSTILGKRDSAFATLLFECGLTISELINADVSDIKRHGDKVTLDVKPKGAKGRHEVVVLTPTAGKALHEYLEKRSLVGTRYPLFGTVRGGIPKNVRLSFRGARAAMRKYLWLDSERRLRLDSLRTYCAVRLMNQGRTTDEIRKFMRFKSNVPFRKIMFNSKVLTGAR